MKITPKLQYYSKRCEKSKRIDQNLYANFDNNPNKTNLQFINNDSLSFEKLHTMFALKGYCPINHDSEQKLKLPKFRRLFIEIQQNQSHAKTDLA